MQTIWHDKSGRVKAVYDGDTTSTVWRDRGYFKAVSDPEKNGRLSQNYVVTISNGEVTDTIFDPPPLTTERWLARIAIERERRLSTHIPVTLSGGEYVIPVSDRAAALAPNAEKRARKHGKKVPFPTDKGIIDFDADDLARIEDAIGDYLEAVWRRERELQAKVADGSITEADLEDWP